MSELIACHGCDLLVDVGGLESVMTLRSTPLSLWRYGMPELAILVAIFIIYLPALLLVLLVSISANWPWNIGIRRSPLIGGSFA